MLRSSCFMSFAAVAVVCSFSSSAFGTKLLPTDGTVTKLNAEPLEEAYSKDDHYAYSRSESFTRWVYSPWVQPKLENEELTLQSDPNQIKRAVLISELSMDSSHLNADKSYEIVLRNNYSCEGSDEIPGNCRLRLMVRCYGKTEKSNWDVTFEKIQKFESSKDGMVTLDKSIVKGKDCNQGIHISSEASILPGDYRYSFKGLEIGLKEI